MEVPPLKKASIFGFGLLLGSWIVLMLSLRIKGSGKLGKGCHQVGVDNMADIYIIDKIKVHASNIYC